MILKALEIHGFKSFPDKTVLTFGQGITAVVGPNGSGKSNISDAIRWVLGEQSAKNLRGAKMESVVFDGTAARRGMGFAEVTLVFDNTTRVLDFDEDEVRVTRRYFRSGDSEYLLNNATVRLKDIQMMFMDTGLGRDGYSIVGQGKIGDIVASKSGERREIFEEAAGIAKYRFRKNEAERRLHATEENLLRLRDIVQELEDRVGPLGHQAEKAKKFLVYSEEKKQLEIGLWLHTIEHSREVLRELSDKLELARTQYDTAGADIDAIEAQIEEAAQESERLLAEMDEVRRHAAQLEEQAQMLESQAAVRRNDQQHNAENIERMKGEIEASHQGSEALDKEEEEKRAAIARRRAAIEEQQKQQLDLAVAMQELIRNSDSVSGQMEELAGKAATLASELSDCRVASVTNESALAEITSRLSVLLSDAADFQAASAAAQKELEDCRNGAAACRETVESLQNAASGCEMRAQSREKKMAEAQRTADQCRLDAEETVRRIRLLEEMERSMAGFHDSVKAIMKQSTRGALTGIHAPVSQLLSTEATYALAIETALGQAAQHIVCDTENDGKRGIRYLKDTKGGRATFLPLDTIKGRVLEEKGLEEEDGFLGIASSLVQCDKKYEGIARDLLGRTAIVEDLDSAVVIARRYHYRFRIVSLDGQVINAGGSMTGGSSVKNAGLLSRRAEIERLTEKSKEQEQASRDAAAAFRAAEQEASAAKAQLTATLDELTTARDDLVRMEAELRRLSEQAQSAKAAAEDREKETAALQARAASCREAIAAAAERSAALTEKQDAVNAEIEALAGGRRELAEKREALSEEIAQCKLVIATLHSEIESIEIALRDLDSRRHDAQGYRESLLAQIAAVEESAARMETEIAELMNGAAQFREQAKAGLSRIEELTARRMEIDAQQTAFRQRSRDKADERELAGREIARLEEKQTAAQNRVGEVETKLLEEYELTRAQAADLVSPIEDIPAASRRLQELKNKIRGLGSVNVEAIEEFKEVSERYAFLSAQVNDVEVSKKELLNLIGELTSQMQTMFIERFNQINQHFGEVFTELFEGGKATLSLTDPDDVLNTGIEMHVQPPGKKILHLEALSGGEKALVAIALLFAILRVTPSPFCVLDEIEAALDDVNVDRYAQYLRRMCDRTQFIVITHRRGTMEEADVLYGVTMQEKGVSKLLELRVGELEEKLGMEAE
ncbi:MAG: chromosome segregation protein SMC [Ruminococcaceae bacterium]|nr:chromosome segregation protein SMC [Oscillospiraceae bacterium]